MSTLHFSSMSTKRRQNVILRVPMSVIRIGRTQHKQCPTSACVSAVCCMCSISVLHSWRLWHAVLLQSLASLPSILATTPSCDVAVRVLVFFFFAMRCPFIENARTQPLKIASASTALVTHVQKKSKLYSSMLLRPSSTMYWL